MHGVYGTLDAELEVQRTIKRAKLTSFLCPLRKAIGPTVVHVDKKVIIDGLCRGGMKCIGREGRRFVDLDLGGGAQRTPRRHSGGGRARQSASPQKEKKQMSVFEKFIAEGNEKLAKEGAMLDGGGMAQIRVTEVQQKREEVYAAWQHASSSPCLVVGVTRQ